MTFVERRLAVDQTPITALGLFGSIGTIFPAVKSLVGTWMAIECTLNFAVLSTAFAASSGIK